MENGHEVVSNNPDFDETLPKLWHDFCAPPGALQPPWGGQSFAQYRVNFGPALD